MKKILLVDDDKTLQTMLTGYLEKQGYSVSVATSGVQGLELFDRDPPDLILSAIVMPGMDGLEFSRHLRVTTLGRLVPFIFLTAKKNLENLSQAYDIGSHDYMTKPFEPLKLLAKIEAQLERLRGIHCLNLTLLSITDRNEDLPLTPIELHVFWEVTQGLTNRQISQRLFIGPHAFPTHLSNILTKLNIENRSQLVRFAFEHGYRPPQTQDEQRATEARC